MSSYAEHENQKTKARESLPGLWCKNTSCESNRTINTLFNIVAESRETSDYYLASSTQAWSLG